MNRKRSRSKALRAVAPNAGLKADYRRKLLKLIDAMGKEAEKEIREIYEYRENRITMDASPAAQLSKKIQEIRKRWQKRFNDDAEKIAFWFARKVFENTKRAQKSALKSAGLPDITVKFDKGSLSRDMMQAIIEENVSLIKSIPSEYFQKVEGSVMRSVTAGRDIFGLAKDLEKNLGVTARRAELIARDQNDKATNTMAKARDLSAGFTHGIWIHVAGRFTSRSTHEKMHGKEFDLKEGMYDSAVGKNVFPAELVNCRCRYRPVFNLEEWKK